MNTKFDAGDLVWVPGRIESIHIYRNGRIECEVTQAVVLDGVPEDLLKRRDSNEQQT